MHAVTAGSDLLTESGVNIIQMQCSLIKSDQTGSFIGASFVQILYFLIGDESIEKSFNLDLKFIKSSNI